MAVWFWFYAAVQGPSEGVRRGDIQGIPLCTYFFIDICILAGYELKLAESRLGSECLHHLIEHKSGKSAVSAAAKAAQRLLE